MKSKRDVELLLNQEGTPLVIFLESYNRSIPASYPRATTQALKMFQKLHPVLFRKGDGWSIDKHRKKVMDWLPAHINILQA